MSPFALIHLVAVAAAFQGVDADRWDLLRIAENEAERSAQVLAADLERQLQSAVEAPSLIERQERVRAMAAKGPDLVPVLVAHLARIEDTRRAYADGEVAMRTLLAIAEGLDSQPRKALFEELQLLLGDEDGRATRLSILRGLSDHSHPWALAQAQGFLDDPDDALRHAAIDVLAAQESKAAAGMLRPKIAGAQVSDRVVLFRALRRLRDTEASDAVAEVLAVSEELAEIEAAIAFLSRLGEQSAIGPLARILTSGRGEGDWADRIRDSVRRQCATAIAEVGLRGDMSTRQEARRTLRGAWQELTRTDLRKRVAVAIGQLGGSDETEVFQFYEKDVQERIRNNRNDPGLFAELAELQCNFQLWAKAESSVKKGMAYDRDSLFGSTFALLLARVRCGREEYDDAADALGSYQGYDRATLPGLYPEMRKMAELAKYRSLFE